MRLLLDSHISPSVVRSLQRRCPRLEAVHLRDWLDGAMLDASDTELLKEASRQGYTFVTYDLRTIVPLLRQWAETGQHHAGVILADDATVPPQQVGPLVNALRLLWRAHGEADWADRIQFLRRVSR